MTVNAFVRTDDHAKQVSASPLGTNVRTKEKRLQKSAQAATRDPPLSPGRSTSDIAFRESSVVRFKGRHPPCKAARLCFLLDLSPVEKG